MRQVAAMVMSVLVSVTCAHASERVANRIKDLQDSIDELADRLANRLIGRDHEAMAKFVDKLVDKLFVSLFAQTVGKSGQLPQDNTTLGKPGHLVGPPRTVLRRNLDLRPDLPFRLHRMLHASPDVAFGDSDAASLLAGYRLQSSRRAMLVQAGNSEDDLPPVLKDDFRDFRARLVAAEQGGSNGTGPGWMYETTLLEQGSVLLTSMNETFGIALHQQCLHKAAIMVLKHKDPFTKGIILNRPTAMQLDGWSVWYGGENADGGLFQSKYSLNMEEEEEQEEQDVTCLHRLESEPIRAMSDCVIKDIYNISFGKAKILVAAGEAKKEDFWVFVGHTGWNPGQLEIELAQGNWYLAAADSALLLGELLTLAGDPLTLPRVDSTGRLSAGGDGLGTWQRLAAKMGRKDDSLGDFPDRMLREWVLRHLTKEGQKEPYSDISNSDEKPSLDIGTVLVSSSARPFLLEKQYLHKAIIIVLQNLEDAIIAAVLNRPMMLTLSFNLPGPKPDKEKIVERRLSYGGDFDLDDDFESEELKAFDDKMIDTDTILPFHHKRELGGTQLGDSGLFVMEDNEFSGEASDLLLVKGAIAWDSAAYLQRQIKEGMFSVVPKGKVPWERIWELVDESTMNSNSLEERIADVRQTEETESGKLEVRKKRAVRMTKRSCEAWEFVISQVGVKETETSDREKQLADEALFEWARLYAEYTAAIEEGVDDSDEYYDDEDDDEEDDDSN